MRVLLITGVFLVTVFRPSPASGQQAKGFDGLSVNLGNLPRLSAAKTRSISPENFTGEKGRGGMAP